MHFSTKRSFLMCKGKTFKILPLQTRATPVLNALRTVCSRCELEGRRQPMLAGLETELRALYDYVRKIRLDRNFQEDIRFSMYEVDASNSPDSCEVRMLDTLLEMIESNFIWLELESDIPEDTPLINTKFPLTFAGMTYKHMAQLNIRQSGFLKLKKDYESRVAMTKDFGKTEHWSSEGLYRHLCMLRKVTNEAATHMWINGFLFRAAAMFPPGMQMALNTGQYVSTMIKPEMPHSFTSQPLGGYVDYTAVMASPVGAAIFQRQPSLQNLKLHEHGILFVSEAKTDFQVSFSLIPQAICKMYACAKQLGKTTVRGALTDGKSAWIFFILKTNPDGNGATYAMSDEFYINYADYKVSHYECTMISGIIAHWASGFYSPL
ncbi:hypothetical protein M378DRAFT_199504 [Amanita muscaria Koide BX008]|uniref:Uncharacterized protein n=1 Tax=Amanita muscaria (strain Koide BX008) TaxID=946122 RepID=A0A0C2SEQ5_AMAMK|nr:hypothetical protein M378DRAFT_199504 [Amanita muscaria Koide BX008]